MEEESAVCCGGIDVVRDRNESDIPLVQVVDNREQVAEGPTQSVEFVDNYGFRVSSSVNILDQVVKSRSSCMGPGGSIFENPIHIEPSNPTIVHQHFALVGNVLGG